MDLKCYEKIKKKDFYIEYKKLKKNFKIIKTKKSSNLDNKQDLNKIMDSFYFYL